MTNSLSLNEVSMSNEKLNTPETLEIDRIVSSELSTAEFEIRAKAEIKVLGDKIAKEIKAVLDKYNASIIEWNGKLWVLPEGFAVYSEWNFPSGAVVDMDDLPGSVIKSTGVNNSRRIVKPFNKSDLSKD